MDSLISNLIRPFRFTYSLIDLGPKKTDKYHREDKTLLNDRGQSIQYSYYKNLTHSHKSQNCFIYAHCNSGCRIEGIQFLESVVEKGWNVCLFDFGGSGISEGEFISLGYYESMDLQVIVSEMLRRGNSKIHLWGRSMGAATIILYLSETKQIQNIVSCVLDSPYSSLWRVIKQFGKNRTKIPQFIIQYLMSYIRSYIQKNNQFDIKSLELLPKVQKITTPMMFIVSTSDSFVSHHHTTQLYKWTTSTPKVMQYIDKEHNSPRETHVIEMGLTFMSKSLSNLEKKEKNKQFFVSKGKTLNGANMAEFITKPIKGIKKNCKNKHIDQCKSSSSIPRHNKSNIVVFCDAQKKTLNSQQQTPSKQNEQKIRHNHSMILIGKKKYKDHHNVVVDPTEKGQKQKKEKVTKIKGEMKSIQGIKRFHSFSFIKGQDNDEQKIEQQQNQHKILNSFEDNVNWSNKNLVKNSYNLLQNGENANYIRLNPPKNNKNPQKTKLKPQQHTKQQESNQNSTTIIQNKIIKISIPPPQKIKNQRKSDCLKKNQSNKQNTRNSLNNHLNYTNPKLKIKNINKHYKQQEDQFLIIKQNYQKNNCAVIQENCQKYQKIQFFTDPKAKTQKINLKHLRSEKSHKKIKTQNNQCMYERRNGKQNENLSQNCSVEISSQTMAPATKQNLDEEERLMLIMNKQKKRKLLKIKTPSKFKLQTIKY